MHDLRSFGLRHWLVVAAVCALSTWGCNATEKESPRSTPEGLPDAPQDAVFGLSWSYTEDQLLAADVISGEPEPFRGKLGRMYSEAKMPRTFEDAEWCALVFNDAGEMIRIACVGKPVKDDLSGEAIRKRYEELKEIISRKIPIAGIYEDKKNTWQADKDWWASLKDGKTHWATGFRGEVMEAVLEIHAESDTAGAYNLIVDHLPRMQELNRASDQKDKSVF